jgi:hypothetical protein
VNGKALRATNGHCQHRPAVIEARAARRLHLTQSTKTTQSRANRWRAGTPNPFASEIGAMSDSHNTDDLVNDMLADMCGLIVKTIALIPPDRDDDRLSACAFVLEQINEGVNRVVNAADRTEH